MKKFLLFTLFIFICFAILSCNENSTKVQNDEVLVAKLKSIADSVMLNTHVPGMIIGIWAPEKNLPEWIYTTGKADIQNNISMSKNLLFRIGSNTKTFTVTVLLQLIDEKKLSLEDKLSKFFPQYPNADSITIEMLTDMTSGYYNYTETEEFTDILEQNHNKYFPPDELINLGLNHAPYCSPGKEFHYSNTNTIILGKLIESITKNPLEDEINNRIVNRIGLTNTYLPTRGTEITGEHTHGYYNQKYDSNNPDYTNTYDISWAWAAGGLVSNLSDIKKYVESLTNGGLISDSLQQVRMTFKRQITSTAAYGIGVFNLGGFIGHNGGLPGYTSIMVRDPIRKCTIIIFLNCMLDEASPDQIFKKLTQTIYPEISW